MSKEICISTTPHETRLAILENDELAEIYYERENEYTLAGSIYKGRVTRVLPGMQSAFVDIGLERDAFLYVTDFLEEQEDSADFERTNLSGNPQQRRENGRGRQSQTEQVVVQESAAAPARDEGSGEDNSPSGTRRWRGRRGRGRGMRQRGRDNNEREASPREDQVQKRPVEAGSEEIRYDAPAPSASSPMDTRIYESEAAFERKNQTPAPPPSGGRTLLPGESLSKYGGAPAVESSKPQTAATLVIKTNYTAPKPSTLIETPQTWDGASLLPGESRAPRTRSRSESTPEPAFAESQIAEHRAIRAGLRGSPAGRTARNTAGRATGRGRARRRSSHFNSRNSRRKPIARGGDSRRCRAADTGLLRAGVSPRGRTASGTGDARGGSRVRARERLRIASS